MAGEIPAHLIRRAEMSVGPDARNSVCWLMLTKIWMYRQVLKKSWLTFYIKQVHSHDLKLLQWLKSINSPHDGGAESLRNTYSSLELTWLTLREDIFKYIMQSSLDPVFFQHFHTFSLSKRHTLMSRFCVVQDVFFPHYIWGYFVKTLEPEIWA
jgi:hypothetical protein